MGAEFFCNDQITVFGHFHSILQEAKREEGVMFHSNSKLELDKSFEGGMKP